MDAHDDDTARDRRREADLRAAAADGLEQLGDRMRERRERGMHLSIRQAAKRAGISPTAWASLENGYRIIDGGERRPPTNPTDQTLLSIARGLGVAPDTVFGWAGRSYDPLGHDSTVDHPSDLERRIAAVEGDLTAVRRDLDQVLDLLRRRDGSAAR